MLNWMDLDTATERGRLSHSALLNNKQLDCECVAAAERREKFLFSN